MAKTRINEIVDLMKSKSVAKQQAYNATMEVMNEFKKVMEGYEHNLNNQIKGLDKNLEVKYTNTGDFEAHIKFSGDTLVFMMHTNIFDFENNHAINKTKYVQEDPMREYCGLIQVYNFLSDSLKYNREGDMGSLVARIFINKDKHFFMDGNRPFNFLYNEFDTMVMEEKHTNAILEEIMLYSLKLDLIAPPFEMFKVITVEQKNYHSHNSGFSTSRLGFHASFNSED
jgi:hypothetical protein